MALTSRTCKVHQDEIVFWNTACRGSGNSRFGKSCLPIDCQTRVWNRVKDAFERKPSPEMVLKWTDSFTSCLRSRVGYRLFHKFLCSEFSEDNLEFWLVCEKYKKKSCRVMRMRLKQQIYEKYVAPDSPHEVNLSDSIKKQIQNNLDSTRKDLFDEAQMQIQILMENDSYRRFVRSVLSTLQNNMDETTHIFCLQMKT